MERLTELNYVVFLRNDFPEKVKARKRSRWGVLIKVA